MPVTADPFTPFERLLADRAFWSAFEVSTAELMTPVFFGAFIRGYTAGLQVEPVYKAEVAVQPDFFDVFEMEAIEREAREAILDYVPEFANDFTTSTYNQIRESVLRARANGTGVEPVIKRMAELFGPTRAENIGVTETTRLFGLGAQASYRAQGFNGWEWMSVNDPWVDAVCAGLAADSEAHPFPMDKLFVPAHPRCRCFPSPVVIDVPKPAAPVDPMPFPNGGFGSTADIENWARAKYPDIEWGFGTADVNIMNPSMKRLDELLQTYPEAGKHLKQVFDVPQAIRDRAISLTDDRSWYALVTRDGRTMVLNTSGWYDSYARMSAQLTSDSVPVLPGFRWDVLKSHYVPVKAGPGWHPLGTGNVESVVTHEFGHVLDYQLRSIRGAYTPYVRMDGGGTASDVHRRFLDQQLTKRRVNALSQYAGKNEKEAFAEAFAQMHSDLPQKDWSPVTRSLKKYLDGIAELEPTKSSLDLLWLSDLSDAAARDAGNRAIIDLYEKLGLKYELPGMDY